MAIVSDAIAANNAPLVGRVVLWVVYTGGDIVDEDQSWGELEFE